MTAELLQFVQGRLRQAADAVKAPQMAAYMKTDMPFYGVQKKEREAILRHLRKRFEVTTAKQYRAQVLALWNEPHREQKYLAIAWARQHEEFIAMPMLPLYRRLIREGAWWDLVDEVATKLIGKLLVEHRAKMRPVLEEWIDHDDMWLRRTAIIAQVGRRDHVDRNMLFDFALRRAHESEFFIRKAIGWSLRDYAWKNPAAVRRFLKQHGDKLAPLSYREAAKNL